MTVHASTIAAELHACGQNGHTTMLLGVSLCPSKPLAFGRSVQFFDDNTPKYEFDDDILAMGVAYWVSLVHQELGWLGAGA